MLSDETMELGDSSLFLVRQPVFDRDRNVWGYELKTNAVEALDGLVQENMVDAFRDTLAAIGENAGIDKKIFVSADLEELLGEGDTPIDWGNCVVTFSGESAGSREHRLFVETMKQFGGTMLLDQDVGAEVFDELAAEADIFRVSLAGKSPRDIVKARHSLKDFPGRFLASDIESWEAYEGTRALGFDLFQGSFFSRPFIDPERDISSGNVAKLQLLRELNNSACELDELSAIISTDVALSYKLLKYINSASFGMRNRIRSIPQAVSLLGLKEVRHWAMVVIMADLDPTPRGEELAYMALQRARFLGKLASVLSRLPQSGESMFLLGLFSKLDALLSYDMRQALADIPLDHDMKAALCGEENEYREWLDMLDAVEQARWGYANGFIVRFGACLTKAATEYLKASSWAARQLPNIR
ncbi:EAL and HDOD domain-containing protein [Pseudodesulfovibrio tunisiensis]|uniref:EAL and HDOD domain-containing protein n=1 Tax=Pseudodesulfovibrio tunisiensis TaxID=463192 RepID=UPI001FB4C3E5|nr:HDOD domain-containing protein [Pseudodesulfovibrio tunisiensis]